MEGKTSRKKDERILLPCVLSLTAWYSNYFGSAQRTYMKLMILATNLFAKWHLWNWGPLVCPGVTPISISWIPPERRVQPAVANRVFTPNTDSPPPPLFFVPAPPSCHTYIVHLFPALLQILLCFPALLEMLHTCTHIWHKQEETWNKTSIYT